METSVSTLVLVHRGGGTALTKLSRAHRDERLRRCAAAESAPVPSGGAAPSGASAAGRLRFWRGCSNVPIRCQSASPCKPPCSNPPTTAVSANWCCGVHSVTAPTGRRRLGSCSAHCRLRGTILGAREMQPGQLQPGAATLGVAARLGNSRPSWRGTGCPTCCQRDCRCPCIAPRGTAPLRVSQL